MTKHNPLIERKISDVKESLRRYIEEGAVEGMVAGVHLVSDVKKGYIAAKDEADENLLWRIYASRNIPVSTSELLLEFLRKAQQGAYFADERAITASFERTPDEPEVAPGPAPR
ncbi:hypothetical protein [Sulfitobacter sp. R18_1]|uniref:hypothetical protein n=1 Tax=Sulfitobacter sp. R18_1 TaxID=2821104 RepID=UPI001ADBC7E9|nr:hypothetical protein [Sulfitobacter sp. R18_1]MBO9428214.1 hypothetical protein [Sulfitobacter sp. R18_1]